MKEIITSPEYKEWSKKHDEESKKKYNGLKDKADRINRLIDMMVELGIVELIDEPEQ